MRGWQLSALIAVLAVILAPPLPLL